MHQNVTVSLPVEVVREARHLAVDEGLSLSRFVANVLAERIEGMRRYREARERQTELLRVAFPLGTNGAMRWERNELHER